jgi:hypothetical protein
MADDGPGKPVPITVGSSTRRMVEGAKGSMNRSSQNQSMARGTGAPYMCGDRSWAHGRVRLRFRAGDSGRIQQACPGVVAVMPEIDSVLCLPGRRLDRRSCVPLQEYIDHIRPASDDSTSTKGELGGRGTTPLS